MLFSGNAVLFIRNKILVTSYFLSVQFEFKSRVHAQHIHAL